ncbi:MAG: hypothetical protein SGI77_16295 [Pirellulaceae bacterium]|nr:hypothetical protein [Pirellulaceae bacterium]
MIHSSSRPANVTASSTSNDSGSEISAVEDVPFDVNVSTDSEAFKADNEQLIHNEQSLEFAAPFVKKWNQLISQTNWEKGSIIVDWRANLIASGIGSSAYSDEAWSRIVEGVSPQHVGRLRRVYDRFKGSYATYTGLYWTHFMSALDWSDAEMWLEGAVQSGWSVSQMRRTRWQAMGEDPSTAPDESEIVTAEADEDFEPLSEDGEVAETNRELQDRMGTTGPLPEGPDFGEGETTGAESESNAADYQEMDVEDDEVHGDLVSPFASLPQLPVDIADALEQFKLAIVRHRASKWQDVSPATIQLVLDALGAFTRSGG